MSAIEAFQDANVLKYATPEVDVPRITVHAAEDVLGLIEDGFGRELGLYSQGSRALGRPSRVIEDAPLGQVYFIDRETGKEGNRTSMNDRVARWAIEGDRAAYLSLTAIQHRVAADDVLSEDNFSYFTNLARSVAPTPREFRTFRAGNLYADIGKTDRLVEWARSQGLNYMDHDEIAVQLFEPGNEDARRNFVPSSYSLERDQLESVVQLLRSEFHIAQLHNGQATPAQLVGFFKLRRQDRQLAIFSGICDIGGAQGDSIISGSPTLTNANFTLLRGEADILLDERFDDMPPEQAAAEAYELVIQFRGEQLGGAANGFGYNPTDPDPHVRAMIRQAMMFRGITNEQAATMRRVFETNFGEVTQALGKNFLNTTGFEGQTAGGAAWSMYASTAAHKVLQGALRSGAPFQEAIASAMRIIARIQSAALRIDLSDADLTNVVAYDLAKAADEDWRKLLEYDIVAEKIGPGQARVFLKTEAPFEFEHTRPLARLGSLAVRGTSILIAVGGGGDSYSSAYVRRLLGYKDPGFTADGEPNLSPEGPVLVTVWGDKAQMRNARPLSAEADEHIFMATPETTHGQRLYEDLLAARGLTVFMIARENNVPTDMPADLARIAEYLNSKGHPVKAIDFVDTGGDLVSAPQLPGARLRRDHISFAAGLQLRKQLGLRTRSRLFVAVPGPDAQPDTPAIVEELSPHFYTLTDRDAAIFQEQAEIDGLPSAHKTRYSQMIGPLWLATHPETRAHHRSAIQPHLLPVEQALARRGKARPAFVAVRPYMGGLLIFDSLKLAQRIGIES